MAATHIALNPLQFVVQVAPTLWTCHHCLAVFDTNVHLARPVELIASGSIWTSITGAQRADLSIKDVHANAHHVASRNRNFGFWQRSQASHFASIVAIFASKVDNQECINTHST
eukprot:jgi/Bigna1/62374/fgenesh1_kg.34_\